MGGATHFIEVVKMNNYEIINLPLEPWYMSEIKNLQEYLTDTKKCKLKTIAIWYLKPKVKQC